MILKGRIDSPLDNLNEKKALLSTQPHQVGFSECIKSEIKAGEESLRNCNNKKEEGRKGVMGFRGIRINLFHGENAV